MLPKKITSNDAPASVGPYSQAIEANGFVFCSGQIGLDPKSGELADGGISAQTEQAIKNLQAVLEAANCKLDNVVKTTIYLKNIADYAIVNEIYGNYFLSKPARATVGAVEIPKGAMVEIECVAQK